MSAAPARWSGPLRLMHWAMAVLLLGLVGLGWVMTHLKFDLGTTFTYYQWHKSFGTLALAALVLRGVFRLASRRPPDVGGAGWQRGVAHGVHLALYGVMLALPVSGWLMASASPLHLPTRPFNAFTLPDLVSPNMGLFTTLTTVHTVLAYALLALLALHVLGALKHQFVDRDGLMRRMTF